MPTVLRMSGCLGCRPACRQLDVTLDAVDASDEDCTEHVPVLGDSTRTCVSAFAGFTPCKDVMFSCRVAVSFWSCAKGLWRDETGRMDVDSDWEADVE